MRLIVCLQCLQLERHTWKLFWSIDCQVEEGAVMHTPVLGKVLRKARYKDPDAVLGLCYIKTQMLLYRLRRDALLSAVSAYIVVVSGFRVHC